MSKKWIGALSLLLCGQLMASELVIESWRTLRRWRNAANSLQAEHAAKKFTPWGNASVQ